MPVPVRCFSASAVLRNWALACAVIVASTSGCNNPGDCAGVGHSDIVSVALPPSVDREQTFKLCVNEVCEVAGTAAKPSRLSQTGGLLVLWLPLGGLEADRQAEIRLIGVADQRAFDVSKRLGPRLRTERCVDPYLQITLQLTDSLELIEAGAS
jgi:hypothetical protein